MGSACISWSIRFASGSSRYLASCPANDGKSTLVAGLEGMQRHFTALSSMDDNVRWYACTVEAANGDVSV